MSVQVVTDSHSSISRKEAEALGVLVLPMPFTVNGVDYLEDVTLSREDFMRKLTEGADVATSQPAPGELAALWDKALEKAGEVVYIPISSGLSGACASAMRMAQEEKYAGRVFVVDNGRVATPQYRTVLDALELAAMGMDAADIKRQLEDARADMTIYVAVNTLEYLKKGGRISAGTAVMGTLLGIKPVLQFDVGTLNSFKKVRGMAAARQAMIKALRNDLDTKFKPWMDRDAVHLLAASSAGEAETAAWVKEIERAFPGMPVQCAPLSLAVSCHIGPGGLGIGCSCMPQALAAAPRKPDAPTVTEWLAQKLGGLRR